MCSDCYFLKTPKVKNDINTVCGLKGRELNSRSLGYFVLFFVWAAGGQRK
jgi:hypothetical protein